MSDIQFEQARELAGQHLSSLPPPRRDYRYVLPASAVETSDGWYFDYRFEPVKPIPESEWEAAGGAPGFAVSKADGSVWIVSWEEFGERGLGDDSPA